MGLGGSAGSTAPIVHHIKVNASAYGTAIPLAYGRCRLPALFLWTGGFFSRTSSSGAGKGFGTGAGGSVTTYFVSAVLGLCVGPIAGFGRNWAGTAKGKSRGSTATKWTAFLGNLGQAAWSYLTTKHPGQDIGYTGIACVARQAWPLGTSSQPPNMNFEVFGILSSANGSDVNVGDIINDYFTNATYGLGLSSSLLGNILTTFKQYCLAAGYNLSPVLDSQKKAVEWLKDLMHICNADAVWSQGVLNFIPLIDASSTALNGRNGSTFNANTFLTSVYSLTDDDFVTQDKAGSPQRKQITSPQDYDPVSVQIVSPADRFNVLKVEYVNASNDYNLDVVEAKDEGDITAFGLRHSSPLQFHPITTASLARTVAQIQLQQQLHTPNQYRFRVTQRYLLLDPLDVVNITDSGLGLNQYPVRILDITEEPDSQGGMGLETTLVITAQDLGPNYSPGFNTQPPGPWGNEDPNRVPLPVNTPILFEPGPAMLRQALAHEQLNGALEIWILASGNEGEDAGTWQGANVYMSFDGSTYNPFGVIRTPAQMGTLTATLPSHTDPDTVNTLQIDLTESNGIVTSVTHALATSHQNLALVDGEVIAFADVASVGSGNQFNLTYLRRGQYKSPISSHSSGALFGFLGAIHSLDPGVFRVPFTHDMIGQTIFFKLTSVNPSADGESDLAAATPYSIVLTGKGHVSNVVPKHVKPRKSNHTYAANAFVKPTAANQNGFYFQNIAASGASGAIEPTWPNAIGATVIDGAVTWVAAGPLAEIDLGSVTDTGVTDTSSSIGLGFPAWVASHSYPIGAGIADGLGDLQEVTVNGTSGGSVPAWNTTVGGNTTDNSVTWKNQANGAAAVGYGTYVTLASVAVSIDATSDIVHFSFFGDQIVGNFEVLDELDLQLLDGVTVLETHKQSVSAQAGLQSSGQSGTPLYHKHKSGFAAGDHVFSIQGKAVNGSNSGIFTVILSGSSMTVKVHHK